MNFLEFVNKRQHDKIVDEGFKSIDVDKAITLIDKYLKKNIDNLLPLVGYSDVTSDGVRCVAKTYIVTSNDYKTATAFNINWLKTGDSNNVYSIDFYDNDDIIWKGSSVARLSLYTLGSSIAYFLPIIVNIVNSGNYNISKEEAIKLGRSVTAGPNESVKYDYWVGAQKYVVYENLSNNVITDTFKLTCEKLDKDARDFRVKKRNELIDARNKNRENPSSENNARAKQAYRELQEIENAIKGGASTLEELKLAIKKSIKVVQEINDSERNVEEEFNKEKDDPETVFKKMHHYVNMVINGLNTSVILCGAPGVGKTYNVKSLLKSKGYVEGTNCVTIKGKCSPRQLYIMLYTYQDKGQIMIIDDADSLVGPKAPEDTINILKAALDSSADDEGRLVSYNITGDIKDEDGNPMPKRFYYNGSIIVITNYQASALDTALKGRAFVQDIHFDTEDVLNIIKKLMPKIDPMNLSGSSKQKAYEFLTKLSKEKGNDMEISIRTFGICAKFYRAAEDDPDFDDEMCEAMIREQMKLQAARGRGKY